MRFVSVGLGLCLAVALILTSPARAAESDMERLQGDWTAEVETDNGKKKATLTVAGKKIRFDGPDGREWYEGTFVIDDKAKPKRISVLIKDCPIDEFKKQTVEGIYTLEGDTWTVCATAPGAPEGPSGFDDEKARTIVFKKDR
ncbi:TIGR03067 domain-containing protein [Stieleria mannarensis]|uniref:TIGR03067 domain-containing protein n=1 Tax=Stieleria mannarensis TaxID=2755585 RepID=UPI0016037CFB|nr:TIGR03067 domain-containing protein [Rhodopirellula sp. JC639]